MAVRVDFNQLNRDVRLLIAAGVIRPNIGVAIPPKAVTIRSANHHMSKHGVDIETAQGYVDSAVVMFDQGNRLLYMSIDGNCVVLKKERFAICAYGFAKFDPAIKAIWEAVINGLRDV